MTYCKTCDDYICRTEEITPTVEGPICLDCAEVAATYREEFVDLSFERGKSFDITDNVQAIRQPLGADWCVPVWEIVGPQGSAGDGGGLSRKDDFGTLGLYVSDDENGNAVLFTFYVNNTTGEHKISEICSSKTPHEIFFRAASLIFPNF